VNIQPEIIPQSTMLLVGVKTMVSLTDYPIQQLWQKFIPLSRSIAVRKSDTYVSVAIYPDNYFNKFNPTTMFERWAAVEVESKSVVPAGLEQLLIPEGLYAVFHYRGKSSNREMFQYIFQTWLPSSEYLIDQRPHFEVLDHRYKNDDPESEEEIWIPVKERLAL